MTPSGRMRHMELDDLLAGVPVIECPGRAGEIRRLAVQSGAVDSTTLFAACRYRWLGRRGSVLEAVRRGAAVVMIEENDDRRRYCEPQRTIVVRDVHRAYATVCGNLFGNAHRHLRLYAVTGTKGKTTTCHLI